MSKKNTQATVTARLLDRLASIDEVCADICRQCKKMETERLTKKRVEKSTRP